MARTLTADELIAAFRPRDRREVELPTELRFPLALDPFVTWHVGPRAFLVLPSQGEGERPPMGLVFHRDASGPAMPAMCEWCHATRGRGEVTLLSCEVTHRRYVGLYLCRDLGCGKRSDDYPRPENFYERRTADERMAAILTRMRTFAKRHLF